MTDHRKIEQAASDWIVRRSNPDGSWSHDDQRALESWLAESAAHKVAFVRLDVAWRRADKLRALSGNAQPGSVPETNAWQQSPFFARRMAAEQGEVHLTHPVDPANLTFRPRTTKGTPLRGLRAAAAVLVVGVGAAVSLGVWYAGGRQQQSFHTALGASRQEAIADGSLATLSSDSEVIVSLSRSRRDIDLAKGEAYFEVAKDASRPFVVNAGGTTATAIGTKFSVRRDDNAVRLVVTEGTVRLDPSIAGNKMPSATFTAGAIALVTKDGIRMESRSPEQAAEALGWLSGDVVFHGTPLRDAIIEFNRFNTHKLVIMDPRAGEIRVDGSFKVGNAAGFSRLITQVFPVEVVQKQAATEIHMRE